MTEGLLTVERHMPWTNNLWAWRLVLIHNARSRILTIGLLLAWVCFFGTAQMFAINPISLPCQTTCVVYPGSHTGYVLYVACLSLFQKASPANLPERTFLLSPRLPSQIQSHSLIPTTPMLSSWPLVRVQGTLLLSRLHACCCSPANQWSRPPPVWDYPIYSLFVHI